MDCIFCRVVAGAAPADKLVEDDLVVAIRDIHPVAPVHLLVIPKQHIAAVGDLQPEHGALIARLVLVANEVAHQTGIAASGYRLVVNAGHDGHQTVGHLHVHVLGGRPLGWPPFPPTADKAV